MPFSSVDNLRPVCCELLWLKPKPRRIVDLGIGSGKWGALVREYVDGWGEKEYPGRRTYLAGVEIYEPYVQPWHRALYNDIIIGDMVEFMRRGEHWDLALCVDALEHLEKPTALEFLGLLKKHCQTALVATPVDFFAQSQVFGNIYERHLSAWTAEELGRFGSVQQHGTQFLLKVDNR
jgi:hypothetical protein